MAKLKATVNKAKDVETKDRTQENTLLAEIGRLQLARETHAARFEDTTKRMNIIRQKLASLQNGKE